MSILLLINEQEVKDITGMSENIDAAKFRHQIQVCQDLYIKAAIGETCYDELLDSVENEDPTALETTLLDGDNRSFPGLKSALAWWVYWRAFPDMWINEGNATIQKRTSDKFESVDMEEFTMKRKEAENVATEYTNYLIKYIKKNSETYTCYVCEGLTDLVDEGITAGVAFEWDEVSTLSESSEILRRER